MHDLLIEIERSTIRLNCRAPIALLYIEPVYLEATNSSIPEVKRVIVVYGDRIAYESTLAEALNSLFGEGSVQESDESGDAGGGDESAGGSEDDGQMSQSEIVTNAQEAFDNAQSAAQDGDWAAYGEYLDELEEYLNMLN